MQETLVQSLVWEDPTCGRATKSMRHNYWACALGPGSLSYWASVWEPLKLACPRPRVLCSQRSYHNEKSVHRNWRVAPLAATREKACAVTKSQNNPQNKQINKKIFWKSERLDKDIPKYANTSQKKAGVAILISHKVDFRAKTISKDKGTYFIVIKGLIHLENIVILSVYALHKTSKCMKWNGTAKRNIQLTIITKIANPLVIIS